jgi:hypothetical protein
VPAVHQRGVHLLRVETQLPRHREQQVLAGRGQLVGPAQHGLGVRPEQGGVLLGHLFGGLGGGQGVLVLVQREVAQPDLQPVAVALAQGTQIVQGGVAVGALQIAPDVEYGSIHAPSVPALRSPPATGDRHPGRRPTPKCP